MMPQKAAQAPSKPSAIQRRVQNVLRRALNASRLHDHEAEYQKLVKRLRDN